MNYRLTIAAAGAVVLASFSLFAVIGGWGWFWAGTGAVIVMAAAGLATRQAPIPAAIAATALTAVASVPLLAWPSWWVRLAGLALIGMVAASAVVRRVLPGLAGACTYLAAGLIYLNLAFARVQSAAWVIPTARSLHHLGYLVTQGFAERSFAPPVPPGQGIELIAAAGIGAVAIVTDLVAVRLRSPAVAGLPLLILFSVPVAANVQHTGTGLTLAFCLGISGYLALLATDGRQRLRLWGRLVTVWQDAPDDEISRGPDTRQLAASGRRIGLAAVALAIMVPLALPSFRAHGLFGHHPAPGAGSEQVPQPQPLVELGAQLFSHSTQPVLTYRTTAPDPQEQYLQVYVLNYDRGANSWELPSHQTSVAIGSAGLRNAPGLSTAVGVSTARTVITLTRRQGGYASPHPLSYLPLPYAAQTLRVPGSGWEETNSTLMVYRYKQDSGLTYSVASETATPNAAELEAVPDLMPTIVRQDYGSYTGPDAKGLLARARQIVAGAHTRLAQATALQNWFSQTGGFTYSLTAKPPTSLLQFVTTDKRGFCEQFAFAMAVMARLIGIPSRVAVGYTGGAYDPHHHDWQVTGADAHAWPELYLPGAGWLRFEPTPPGAAGGTATQPTYPAGAIVVPPAGPSQPPADTQTLPAGGHQKLNLKRQIGPYNGSNTPGGRLTHAKGSGSFPIGLVMVLIFAVLLISPALARVLTRRRRWISATSDAGCAHAAWRELSSDLVDYGRSGPRSESPRALARRVSDVAGLDAGSRLALSRITTAEERARYARTPAPAESLRGDVTTVRRAVARSVSHRRRWHARLLPPSMLAPVLAALRQMPDAFGWLDAAGLRLRHLLTRRPARPRRAT